MPVGRHRTLLLVVAAVAAPPVRAAADLSLGKRAESDPVVVNRPIRYRLTVTNRGPDSAVEVRLTDTLAYDPAQFDWQAPSDVTCAFDAPRTVSCRLERLAPGQSRSVELTAAAPARAGTVENRAEVRATSPDPDPFNNTATAAVTAVPFSASADLELTASASPNPVREDGTLSYRLTVRNLGPAEAPGTALTHTVTPLAPADLLSMVSSQGSCRGAPEACIGVDCDPSPLEVRCALGTLAPGGGAGVTLQVRAAAGAGRTLTALSEVTSDRADPQEANNRTSIATRIDGFLDEGTHIACVTSLLARGTPLEAQLPVLRALRDRLDRQRWGRWLVRAHYRASPTLGRWLRHWPPLAMPLRGALRLAVRLLGRSA